MKTNKMKHTIIKTENYLLVVSDEEIKVGDWYLTFVNEEVVGGPRKCEDVNWSFSHCKKIIAHHPLNNTPYLDGVDILPPLDNGEKDDNVEQIAERMLPPQGTPHRKWVKMGLIEGYNKAREKYKFTEDDMSKAWSDGYHRKVDEIKGNKLLYFTDTIISLQQSQYPIGFECEISVFRERPTDMRNHIYDKTYEVPKTITNSEGKTEWVGKYVWE